MAITFKIIGSGVLSNVDAAIYTVPASTTAAIKLIALNNKHTGDVLVTIKVKPSGGTARIIEKITLATLYSDHITDLETLGAGDAIWGVADVDAVIDYVISGVEKT